MNDTKWSLSVQFPHKPAWNEDGYILAKQKMGFETSAVMNRPMMNRPSDETFGWWNVCDDEPSDDET